MSQEIELSERTQEVVDSILIKQPSLKDNFEVVGDWVWCSFDEKPALEILQFLREIGFKWNRKRKIWQNSCGVYSRSSDDDPKQKYPVLQL